MKRTMNTLDTAMSIASLPILVVLAVAAFTVGMVIGIVERIGDNVCK